jgi:hypothetical protein
MGCANVPGSRTPPRQPKGPTDRSPEVKNRELSESEVRQALTQMGKFAEAIAAVERAKEEFAKQRDPEGMSIEMKSPRPDQPIMSRRGRPVVDVFTLFDFPDRYMKADPTNPGRWREVEGSDVPARAKQAHSHYKAELIEVKRPGGKTEFYLSIPKAAAVRESLLRWESRAEGDRLKS